MFLSSEVIGVVQVLQSCKSWHSFLNSVLTKLEPWSLCCPKWAPKMCDEVIKLSVSSVISDPWSRIGNASTHLVNWSIMTRMYLFPEVGNMPSTSVSNQSMGAPVGSLQPIMWAYWTSELCTVDTFVHACRGLWQECVILACRGLQLSLSQW